MVHDIIKFIKPTVRTIGSGWVASAGALIFIGAQKENRLCLPNTRFLMHQPAGGVGGQVSDIQIQADQIKQMRRRFEELFALATGKTPEEIEKMRIADNRPSITQHGKLSVDFANENRVLWLTDG
jgi:ATP-dependent Clp protease protease subunit